MKLDKRPMTEEAKVTTISAIYDDTIDLDKGYYNGVYFNAFNKEDIVDSK